MKWVYTVLVVLMIALVAVFAFQNAQSMTVEYFSLSFELPVFLMAIGIYVLGMLTGGFMTSLVRRIVRGATAKDEAQ